MFTSDQFPPGTLFRGKGSNDNGVCVVLKQTNTKGLVGPDYVWACKYPDGSYHEYIYKLDEIAEILPPETPVVSDELLRAFFRIDRWANYAYTYEDTVAVDSPLSTFTAGDLRLILDAIRPAVENTVDQG